MDGFMRIKGDADDIILIKDGRAALLKILYSQRHDVMDDDPVTENISAWNGEVTAVVTNNDLVAEALPFTGRI